jgi:hypothetical protein
METEEDRQMSNEDNTLVNYNPRQASLLEMRADSDRFPRIKTMPREQAVLGMSKIVTQAFLYRGQAADPTNIQFISSSLVQELLEDSNGAFNLSLAEIQVIVKRAVLNTDMMGINVSSLYKIIIAFVKGEGRENQSRVDALRRVKPNPGGMAMLQAATGEFIRNHKSK